MIELLDILIPLDHLRQDIPKNRLEDTTQLYQNLVARSQGPMDMMIVLLMFQRTCPPTGLFIVSLTHGGTLIAWEKALVWRRRLREVIIAVWQIWPPVFPDGVPVHMIGHQTYFLLGISLLQNTRTLDTVLLSLAAPIPGHHLMTLPRPTNSDAAFTQPPNDRVPPLLTLHNQSHTLTGPMIPVARTGHCLVQSLLIPLLKHLMLQPQPRPKRNWTSLGGYDGIMRLESLSDYGLPRCK